MRLRLTTKFGIFRSIILLATMGVFAYLCVSTLEDVYLQEAIADADNLSETIIRSAHYHMLENDRERAYRMIEEIGGQEGIETIRFFTQEGLINFSTTKSEMGTELDKNAEGCTWCHCTISEREERHSVHSRVFTNKAGVKVLGVTKKIFNEPSCATASCHAHPVENALLGVLDVHVSLEKMQDRLISTRNGVVVFTVGMMLAISISLTLLIQRLVNKPVHELLEHTRRLARGDLNARIEYVRNDELGELAEAFNDMTRSLAGAQNELRQWGETLEAKVEERTCEIKQMQSQLIQSAKLASLGELVAGIAHEINNPLTGILMFSSIAQQDPRLHPDLKNDLAMVVAETERCARIVKNLLEFSHEIVLEKKLDSLNRLIRYTLDVVAGQTALKNVRIVQHSDTALPEFEFDPAQLEQVFMNIILNAGQAMPGGGMLTIVTGRQDPDMAFVQFTDTGSGIADEVIENIFDPFFTTKGRKHGTGLGLSISYGIVKSHGGTIEVASRVGEGTTFTVLLPMNTDTAA